MLYASVISTWKIKCFEYQFYDTAYTHGLTDWHCILIAIAKKGELSLSPLVCVFSN